MPRRRTARADAVLLHPAAGPVLFLGLMALLFAAVFLVAAPATEALDAAIGQLGGVVSRSLGGGLAASFVVDGLLGGAGTVLAFMPQIVFLTVAMELLEASGYLARGAFLVARSLQLMGLSGRAFLPLLMGHACAVPAVQATRIDLALAGVRPRLQLRGGVRRGARRLSRERTARNPVSQPGMAAPGPEFARAPEARDPTHARLLERAAGAAARRADSSRHDQETR
ncbi:nucleoside recognition domain-containing protein [Sorangium sp. So ce1153]|uniref:nucleoside recognition domain-containing protein n=1 Tax=Sorangium sp. So ce1153 TaxID=3133333 RepID=UPI003F5F5974